MSFTLLRHGRRLASPAVLLGARLAGVAFGLLTQIILARSMPTAALGLFFFATSLAAVLSSAAAAGYPQATARLMSRYRTSMRSANCVAFFRCGRRDIIVISAGIAAMVMLLATCLTDPETATAVKLAAATIPILALGQFLGAVANAERKFVLASLPELFFKPLALAVAVSALAWLGLRFSVSVLLSIFLLLSAGAMFVQAFGLRRSDVSGRCGARISRSQTKLWRKAAFPLVIVSMFTMLFADVAILFASPWLARAELAVLAICLKISFLVGFSVQAIHQTILPALAEDLQRGRLASAVERVNEANWVSVGITLISLAIILAFGGRLLAVFDPDFASAHHVLTLLVLAQLVRALVGPVSQMLTVLGLQKIVLAVCPAALGILCLANAVLIPWHGLLGAAVAIMIAIAFWAGVLAFALARTTGVRSYLDIRLMKLRPKALS